MSKKQMDVPLFESRERSLFQDLTNTIMDCSTNMTHNPTDDPKRKSVQSWYAVMLDENKAEYNVKHHIS